MGWFRTLALAAVAAAALTGAAAAQVTYNRGNSADPETLDPHKTSTVYEAHILRDLSKVSSSTTPTARSCPARPRSRRYPTTADATASRSATASNGRTATR